MELSREDLDALLGAYAIDALDPEERDELDRLVESDAELAREVRRLREAAVGLAAVANGAQPAPPSLRAGVLAGASAARSPGGHLANPLGARLPVAELWRRQLGDLDPLLDQLDGDDWYAVTSFGRTVHELLAHLGAVLDLYATELGIGSFDVPPGTPIGHWELTEPRIAEMVAQPPAATIARLRATAGAITAHLDQLAPADLDAPRATSALTLGDRTRLQCFELWMHTDDVRRATGRGLLDPDPERVCALSDLSARFVGLGMLVTGGDRPGRGRLVLTGPGGGTWLVPLNVDEAPAGTPLTEDAVVVVADAVEYCRMAGKLLAIDELRVEVEGDPDLARALLTGAQAFAE